MSKFRLLVPVFLVPIFLFLVPSLAFAELPDGRVYEMVTPPDNQDANVYIPFGVEASVSQGVVSFFPFQVAGDGSAVTYVADATTGGEGEIGRGLGDQYLARRTAGGWQQTNIQPAGHRKTHYQGFSGDLSTGILVSGSYGEPLVAPLSASAPAGGYSVLYTRNDFGGEAGLEEVLYAPLFAAPIAFNRTAPEFKTDPKVEDERKDGEVPVFAGGAGGFGGELYFEANDDVTPVGSELRAGLDARIQAEVASKSNNSDFLYGSVGGQASVVDVLPDGEVAGNATFGGPPAGEPARNPPDFDGVVSGSGGWVYWTDEDSGVVYVRVGGVRTVQVSAGRAQYWTSADGGRYAFYVEGEQLYRFDAQSESREALTGPGGGVQGVLGASKDGEDVYVAARGALAGAAASGEGGLPVEEPGVVNLYLLAQGQAPVFIATLSEADGSEVEPMSAIVSIGRRGGGNSEFGDWQPGLGHRTAAVTAGGDGVVFVSGRGLPAVGFPGGYPGGGADEVYEFRAGADRLFCLSCSSSGEPLHGGAAAAYLPVSWNDVHLPEWVADEGNRVFFDSSEPLVAADTNGVQDVYEWESAGTGSCEAASAVNGGCIYLLSGGTSEADSWFIGASESGDDVFIATRAQLSPLDGNDTFDLYDARVGGAQPVTAPLCTGTGCQGVPEPPPTFATPASATFNGVGNFPPPVSSKPKAKPVKCKKGLVKKKGKCVKKPGAKKKRVKAKGKRVKAKAKRARGDRRGK
jgi:hypothetical protein